MGEILYHYTSLEVLKKILDFEKIRFTKMNSLNDRTEYEYGIKLLKDKITEFENNNKINNRFDSELLDKFSFLDELYSLSFTESGDKLSFWNSYYVDKVTPICIGFDSDKVFISDFIINRCIYDDPYPSMSKERYIWFKNIFDIKNILHISKNREYIQITFQTAHIKQKCFDIEKEWRAVSFGVKNSSLGTFNRGGKEVDYFDQPFNTESICEIIVGPSSQQDINYQEVMSALSRKGLNRSVRKSTIPLVL